MISTRQSLRAAARLFALFAVLAVAAGCGGGDDGAEQAAPEAGETAPAEVGTVHVELMEWMVMPSTSSVPAGEVTFMAMNMGTVEHDLVVLRTELAPSELPMSGDKAQEVGLVEKTEVLDPEGTQELTLTVTPGRYVLICNVPGHYEAGMRAAFTVT